MIKLKDILIESNILKKEDVGDIKPADVKFAVPPPAQVSYAKAAGDGAGKPYTQDNIDFSGTGDESQLITKAINVIKAFENNKNNPRGGYNKKLGRWFKYPDPPGQTRTYSIAYGHFITKGEDFSKGLTDNEAEQLLEKDIRSKLSIARSKIKNFDGLPVTIKIAVINGLFRGDMGPKTMSLLNQNKFADAAREYLNNKEYRTTKNQGVKKRMDWNYNVIKSAA